ncbi:MAG TPA: baseplate J/gp47 family protein, partial [Blastocatellia bacterium]|nr:baseplate J/gp47 family protein [Blastocatellia bacterium]
TNPQEAPVENSTILVNYTTRDLPSGLTDFNAGSVAGTLLRAVAREITLLYAQMDEAYRRAFIDEATGVALDNVVALLGVTRNPARKAKGTISFSLKKGAQPPVRIVAGTRVADGSGHVFVTTKEAVIGNNQTGVDVEIEAVEPGPDSNVGSKAITIMPTPPPKIGGAENKEPTAGGLEAESDDRLRERAKHRLEEKGNATLNAIKFAVLDIDGVSGVEVIDQQVDASLPLGEVRVRYFGGDKTRELRQQVLDKIEKTRAAGVMVRLDEFVEVTISGGFYLIPKPQFPKDADAKFKQAAVRAIEASPIGAPLSLRRLKSPADEIPGLAEVAEAKLTFKKTLPDNKTVEGNVADPLPLTREEMLRPGELTATVLTDLLIVASGKNGNNFTVDLQLTASGNKAEFRDFTLDLRLSGNAKLKEHPDQSAVSVGSFTRPAQFRNGATARIGFTLADLDKFNKDIHVNTIEMTITAAAYPGLREAKQTITVTV